MSLFYRTGLVWETDNQSNFYSSWCNWTMMIAIFGIFGSQSTVPEIFLQLPDMRYMDHNSTFLSSLALSVGRHNLNSLVLSVCHHNLNCMSWCKGVSGKSHIYGSIRTYYRSICHLFPLSLFFCRLHPLNLCNSFSCFQNFSYNSTLMNTETMSLLRTTSFPCFYLYALFHGYMNLVVLSFEMNSQIDRFSLNCSICCCFLCNSSH